MTTNEIAHPPITSREEWLSQRLELLAHEKELTKHYDRVAAERRSLPMVKVKKDYIFEDGDGTHSFLEIFEGRRQLIVYHFMFDPNWDKGCSGCTWLIDAMGDLSGLHKADTTFVLVSRAPWLKLEAYRVARGWDNIKWYSSFGGDFNYDFHVTLDRNVAPMQYNYVPESRMVEKYGHLIEGEEHGQSVFFQMDGVVYHTYSSFGRASEGLTDTPHLLDITPYGRQEDFEDSPPGWPQSPTYG